MSFALYKLERMPIYNRVRIWVWDIHVFLWHK